MGGKWDGGVVGGKREGGGGQRRGGWRVEKREGDGSECE